ncbi:MAG: peptidylprolyl isomerase [Steroidobacteraceae bacterium]|jgi:peptidylprolyl isomerase|nr:peptidylprolyl isomerase [Steroidobacteraceae bacterium]
MSRPLRFFPSSRGMVRCLAPCLIAASAAPLAEAPPPRTMAEVLAQSAPAEWRVPDPENTLYLEVSSGRVVVELAPDFAPAHVANVKALVRAGHFDGSAVVRSQDNYVVQWANRADGAPLGAGKASLPPEFSRPAAGLPFTRLPDPDTYAPETGFSGGFPAARDPQSGQAWLAHCYGMVGAGRDVAPDSGGGTELYAVTGHAPRHLDRNVTLLGRVIDGIERLSSLPRGTGALGFYVDPAQAAPIRAARIAADLPPGERTALELLRTDSASFAAVVESRRSRREEWFVEPTGRIELCNVPLPVRPRQVP